MKKRPLNPVRRAWRCDRLWFSPTKCRYSGIYYFKCVVSGRVYVGSSVDVEERRREHMKCLHKNRHPNPILQNSWNKHGEHNFVWGILERTDNLIEREKHWIGVKGSMEPRGYNLTDPVDQAHAAQDYEIVYPDLSVERIHNLTKTCRERGWNQGNMARIARGEGHMLYGLVIRSMSLSWEDWLNKVPPSKRNYRKRLSGQSLIHRFLEARSYARNQGGVHVAT